MEPRLFVHHLLYHNAACGAYCVLFIFCDVH